MAKQSLTLKPIATKQTKRQIIELLAQETGLRKKQVAQLLEALANMLLRHLCKEGSGEFTIPFSKLRVQRKTRAARPKRQRRNPATGETLTLKAMPAYTVVKARVLKSLQDAIK